MYFNWKRFGAFAGRALHPPPDSPYRLTPKRMGVLVGFLGLFLGTELATRLSVLLDEVVYADYRNLAVKKPVFIIGNPRSGTTFLHRLLARDTETFTTMDLWEILFAPSVIQRRLVRLVARLDRKLGSPAHRLIAGLDTKAAGSNVVHSARLLAPEEDQFLLLHAWSTLAIYHFSGILEEAGPYTHFDTSVLPDEKRQILDVYRQAIRRHLYADALAGRPGRHYLSKNPSASSQVDMLLDAFPSARFIYLARNPLEMVPSMISCLDLTWRLLGDPPRPYAARDYVLDMAKHWYTYPLDRLARSAEATHAIVTFDDLTRQADRVISAIYKRFDLPLGDTFARILDDETEKARGYKSAHHYDLAAMGLSERLIVSEFRETFDRFGFSRTLDVP